MHESEKKEIVRLLGESKSAEAHRLIAQIKPPSLFKYRSGVQKNKKNELCDLDALYKLKLWMPFAVELDDPYDCSVLISEDVVKIVEFARNRYGDLKDSKYIDDVKSIINKTRETSLVCSLSSRKDNIDMWIRYANYGKGFCIEYDFDELRALHPELFPVSYEDIVKSIKEFGDNRKAYIDILLKKTDKLNWKDQDEWRIIGNMNKPSGHGKLIDAPKPKAIYLGYNIDKAPELKEKLTDYCTSENINIGCFEAKLMTKDIGMEFIPFTK